MTVLGAPVLGAPVSCGSIGVLQKNPVRNLTPEMRFDRSSSQPHGHVPDACHGHCTGRHDPPQEFIEHDDAVRVRHGCRIPSVVHSRLLLGFRPVKVRWPHWQSVNVLLLQTNPNKCDKMLVDCSQHSRHNLCLVPDDVCTHGSCHPHRCLG